MTLSCRTGLGQLALVQSSPGVGVQRVRGQIGPSPWGQIDLTQSLASAWLVRLDQPLGASSVAVRFDGLSRARTYGPVVMAPEQ